MFKSYDGEEKHSHNFSPAHGRKIKTNLFYDGTHFEKRSQQSARREKVRFFFPEFMFQRVIYRGVCSIAFVKQTNACTLV